jgi:hypothetical protein
MSLTQNPRPGRALRRPHIIALAAIVVIMIAVIAATTRAQDPGIPANGAAGEQITTYIEALNAEDGDALADALGRPVAHPDVSHRLSLLGGRGLHDSHTEIVSEFAGVYQVWLTVLDQSDTQLEFYEVLEWEDGEWSFGVYDERVPERESEDRG